MMYNVYNFCGSLAEEENEKEQEQERGESLLPTPVPPTCLQPCGLARSTREFLHLVTWHNTGDETRDVISGFASTELLHRIGSHVSTLHYTILY